MARSRRLATAALLGGAADAEGAADGARIWVESTPGDGATFAFTLPVSVEKRGVAA